MRPHWSPAIAQGLQQHGGTSRAIADEPKEIKRDNVDGREQREAPSAEQKQS
jgi:hypothetical protein